MARLAGGGSMVSFRASWDEHESWIEAARVGGLGFSAWARRELNVAAERDLAERRRAADAVADRDRIKSALRGEQIGGW